MQVGLSRKNKLFNEGCIRVYVCARFDVKFFRACTMDEDLDEF